MAYEVWIADGQTLSQPLGAPFRSEELARVWVTSLRSEIMLGKNNALVIVPPEGNWMVIDSGDEWPR